MILSPLAGVIGSYLSIEVIKSILNIKQRNESFMQFDSYQNSVRSNDVISGMKFQIN